MDYRAYKIYDEYEPTIQLCNKNFFGPITIDQYNANFKNIWDNLLQRFEEIYKINSLPERRTKFKTWHDFCRILLNHDKTNPHKTLREQLQARVTIVDETHALCPLDTEFAPLYNDLLNIKVSYITGTSPQPEDAVHPFTQRVTSLCISLIQVPNVDYLKHWQQLVTHCLRAPSTTKSFTIFFVLHPAWPQPLDVHTVQHLAVRLVRRVLVTSLDSTSNITQLVEQSMFEILNSLRFKQELDNWYDLFTIISPKGLSLQAEWINTVQCHYLPDIPLPLVVELSQLVFKNQFDGFVQEMIKASQRSNSISSIALYNLVMQVCTHFPSIANHQEWARIQSFCDQYHSTHQVLQGIAWLVPNDDLDAPGQRVAHSHLAPGHTTHDLSGVPRSQRPSLALRVSQVWFYQEFDNNTENLAQPLEKFTGWTFSFNQGTMSMTGTATNPFPPNHHHSLLTRAWNRLNPNKNTPPAPTGWVALPRQ